MDEGAQRYLPRISTGLKGHAEAVQECRGCGLYRDPIQAVFGEGRRRSEIVMVGEQPGDVEDREGRPFVGPAGRELDGALKRAGLTRRDVYLTNAVKHFKFSERGRRRIHQKPSGNEIRACQPWLMRELELIRPKAIVALGATAAGTLLGPQARITKDRGHAMRSESFDAPIFITYHPSAILRVRESDGRRLMRDDLASDIGLAVSFASAGS